MKRSTEPWTKLIIGISMLMCASCLPGACAWGDETGVELILGQSPTDAGTITPDTGVHRFLTNATISITAIPQTGYRFSHWLGDVQDPSSSTTQIHLNNSKAVMAVYEAVAGGASENGYHQEDYAPGGGAMGLGKAIPTRADFFVNGFSAPGGSVRPKGIRPMRKPTSVPAPVPEPATFFLLGMGSLVFARSTKRKVH
jgi:hypothetical protein